MVLTRKTLILSILLGMGTIISQTGCPGNNGDKETIEAAKETISGLKNELKSKSDAKAAVIKIIDDSLVTLEDNVKAITVTKTAAYDENDSKTYADSRASIRKIKTHIGDMNAHLTEAEGLLAKAKAEADKAPGDGDVAAMLAEMTEIVTAIKKDKEEKETKLAGYEASLNSAVDAKAGFDKLLPLTMIKDITSRTSLGSLQQLLDDPTYGDKIKAALSGKAEENYIAEASKLISDPSTGNGAKEKATTIVNEVKARIAEVEAASNTANKTALQSAATKLDNLFSTKKKTKHFEELAKSNKVGDSTMVALKSKAAIKLLDEKPILGRPFTPKFEEVTTAISQNTVITVADIASKFSLLDDFVDGISALKADLDAADKKAVNDKYEPAIVNAIKPYTLDGVVDKIGSFNSLARIFSADPEVMKWVTADDKAHLKEEFINKVRTDADVASMMADKLAKSIAAVVVVTDAVTKAAKEVGTGSSDELSFKDKCGDLKALLGGGRSSLDCDSIWTNSGPDLANAKNRINLDYGYGSLHWIDVEAVVKAKNMNDFVGFVDKLSVWFSHNNFGQKMNLAAVGPSETDLQAKVKAALADYDTAVKNFFDDAGVVKTLEDIVALEKNTTDKPKAVAVLSSDAVIAINKAIEDAKKGLLADLKSAALKDLKDAVKAVREPVGTTTDTNFDTALDTLAGLLKGDLKTSIEGAKTPPSDTAAALVVSNARAILDVLKDTHKYGKRYATLIKLSECDPLSLELVGIEFMNLEYNFANTKGNVKFDSFQLINDAAKKFGALRIEMKKALKEVKKGLPAATIDSADTDPVIEKFMLALAYPIYKLEKDFGSLSPDEKDTLIEIIANDAEKFKHFISAVGKKELNGTVRSSINDRPIWTKLDSLSTKVKGETSSPQMVKLQGLLESLLK